MKRIDRARQKMSERVRDRICKEGDCKPTEVAVVVTSRKFVVAIPHRKIRVSECNEEYAVRRVLRELKAIRILEALKKRAELAGRKVDVRPHLHVPMGFVLHVPDLDIKVTGRSQRTLLNKVMARLEQTTE